MAKGGVIAFGCGPDPVTIVMDETAKIRNDTGPEIVIEAIFFVSNNRTGTMRLEQTSMRRNHGALTAGHAHRVRRW